MEEATLGVLMMILPSIRITWNAFLPMGKKAFQVMRMEGRIIIRTPKVASSISDQPAHVPHSESCCKHLWIEICSQKIKSVLKFISPHFSHLQWSYMHTTRRP